MNGWKKLLISGRVSQPSVSDGVSVDASLYVTASDEQMEVSALNAEMSEFECFFDSLGYARDDPNWSVPRTWLMEDANDPGYQMMNDEEIVEDLMQEKEESESENEDEPLQVQSLHHKLVLLLILLEVVGIPR